MAGLVAMEMQAIWNSESQLALWLHLIKGCLSAVSGRDLALFFFFFLPRTLLIIHGSYPLVCFSKQWSVNSLCICDLSPV